MTTGRLFHTATLLPSGNVLVAGGATTVGLSSAELATAELYNPATGIWSSGGNMSTARDLPTATLLPDGEVLVAGGFNRINGVLASAELYNPAAGTWSSTRSMSAPRWENIATLLPNGEVLVAGGGNSTGGLSSAELYNPAIGTWGSTGSMSTVRDFPTATLLPNGEVLVAGGINSTGYLASAELYNPATGSWSSTGSMGTARAFDTATLLPDGEVLVAAGQNPALPGVLLASAELYNPATGTWSSTGSMRTARSHHTATLLPDGEVLVAGGQVGGASAELYNPATGAWTDTGSMSTARSDHTATRLPDGEVLVAGGQLSGVGALASAELYTPQAATVDSPITAAGMTVAATEGSPFTGTVATFTDPDRAATPSDYSATIDWGDGSPLDTGVVTGGSGSFSVSGTHTYTEEATDAVTVTITDVDNAGNNAATHSTANVADATLGSNCATPAVSTMSFSGMVANLTDANSFATTSDFTATINWGDGSSSAGTVSSPTGGTFTVSGSHTYSSTGPESISVTVHDDGGSTTSVSGCTVLIFALAPGRGGFVIGSGNSATGTPVTFWGPRWSMQNSMSAASAPPSFKGYALNPATPSCGANWSTDPGNSAPPPAGPLPAFMSVIVTSSSAQSGSQISGNTVHLVVVQTNPGYASDVGHAGTGVVVAQIC
jgi:hypothetical protein